MAIAIRGTTPATASISGAGVPSVTLTGARQPQAGDVLVIIHGNDFFTLGAMTTPTVGGSTTGVTAITNGSADGGNSFGHVKSYTFVVGSTGDLIVAAVETGLADEEKCLIVYVLSGVDTVTPIDVAAGNFNSGTGDQNKVAPSVSPTSADAFLICHSNDGNGSNGVSSTPPGGMAEQYDTSVASAMLFTGATVQLSASGATGTKTFTTVGNSTWATVSIAVKTASGAAAAIPYNPQRTTLARDYGESYWIQKDRRNANLVATAANDLAPPLLVPEHQWQQYRVSDFISRRLVPQQPNRVGDMSLFATPANDLAMPLLQPVDPRYDVTTRLRSTWPQQRELESDPSLLSPTVAMDPPAAQRYIPPRDYGEVQWHQTSGRDPLLLTTALLENELLGGATTAQRANTPATNGPRWWMPQQPQREGYSPGLLDTALLEGPLVWIRPPQYIVDRRLVPQQRAYVSDPSFYSTAGVDPLTVAWGAGSNYWHLYNDVRVERRVVPQQRQLESDPSLLLTALLESPLVWVRPPQYATDRRVTVQLPRFPDPSMLAPPTDPITLIGVGGDLWRRYNTPATHVDRRRTVRERPRWTVYTTVDLGVGANPPIVSTTPSGTEVSQTGTGSTQQTVNVAFVSQGGIVIVSQTAGGVL